jgi:hypothetical protein
MRMGMALEPADVAKSALNVLGRRSTVLPGFLSKLIGYGLAPLPRWARVRIVGRVMRRMTAHRVAAADSGRGQDQPAVRGASSAGRSPE